MAYSFMHVFIVVKLEPAKTLLNFLMEYNFVFAIFAGSKGQYRLNIGP